MDLMHSVRSAIFMAGEEIEANALRHECDVFGNGESKRFVGLWFNMALLTECATLLSNGL